MQRQTASEPNAAQAPPAKSDAPPPASPCKLDLVIPKPDTGTTPATAPATPIGPAPPSYVIGPQDLLRITVFDEAELSSTYRVEPDGMLSYPLVKRIPASGPPRSRLYVIRLNETVRGSCQETLLNEWPCDAASVKSPASVAAAFAV